MSQFSGLSVMNVKRVVRHAIYNHRCFQEKKPGIITHSALTAVLSGDDLARNAMIVQLEEFCPAGIKVSQMATIFNGACADRKRRPMLWRGGLIQKRTTKQSV
jgi:hypothetical protein